MRYLQKFFILFISLCILGCSKTSQEKLYSIEFQLFYKGEKINCANLMQQNIDLKDFKFFIHNIKFDDKLLKTITNQWQYDDVVLLDFNTTNRICSQTGLNKSQNPFAKVILMNKTGEERKFEFSIGVPNHLNHQNPVKASPPLNRSDMHWQWLSGYKFLKLEYEKNNILNRFHHGSHGCTGKLPNNIKCDLPNLIDISVYDFEMGYSAIEVHIDNLVEVKSNSLCMGNLEDLNCQIWVDALQKDTFRSKRQK